MVCSMSGVLHAAHRFGPATARHAIRSGMPIHSISSWTTERGYTFIISEGCDVTLLLCIFRNSELLAVLKISVTTSLREC